MNDDKLITIGLEIECVQKSANSHVLSAKHGFAQRSDSTIVGDRGEKLPVLGPGSATEFVTPILEVPLNTEVQNGFAVFSPKPERLAEIETVIKDLCGCAQHVNQSCGLHVHLGKPNGQPSSWNPRRLPGVSGGPMSEWKPGNVRTMLLIALSIEERLYSVVPRSRKLCAQAKSIKSLYSADDLISYNPIGEVKSRKSENPKRYSWLNLIETRRVKDPNENRIGYQSSEPYGTIEVRLLGETMNPGYVIPWVRLWTKIASAVAYMPAEAAAMRCLHSNWLDHEFEELSSCRNDLERAPGRRTKTMRLQEVA